MAMDAGSPARIAHKGHRLAPFYPVPHAHQNFTVVTITSAVTKLMFLLGQKLNHKQIITALQKNLRGELTNHS